VAEFVVGFPENRLLDSAAALGMRPIERCTAAIASGRTALLEVMTHEEPELALG